MGNCNTLRPLRSQRHCHFWGEEVTWNKSTLVVARSWFLQNMHSCRRQNMSCIYLRFSGMRKSYSRGGIKPMCVFVVNLKNSNMLRPLWSQRHRHFWGEEVTWNKSTLVVARSWFLQNMHSYGRQSMSCKYLRFSGMRKSCSGNGIKPMCVFVVKFEKF